MYIFCQKFLSQITFFHIEEFCHILASISLYRKIGGLHRFDKVGNEFYVFDTSYLLIVCVKCRCFTLRHFLPYFGFNHPCTICPRSSDPFYIVSYYIKWSLTYSNGG